LLASGETLVIERHGEPIGFFVPIVAKDRQVGQAVLGRLATAVASVIDATGLDEEELADEVAGPRAKD
jgi:hypothetical protein